MYLLCNTFGGSVESIGTYVLSAYSIVESIWTLAGAACSMVREDKADWHEVTR